MSTVENKVEVRQVVGHFAHPSGKVLRAGWDMDIVLFKGRQVATINRVPGCAIGLLPGVMLTPSEKDEIAAAVAAKRGGVRPASVEDAVRIPFELLDDEDGDE